MEDSLVERLKAAIEDGEVVTVVYLGGHAPGTKRRILPIRIAEHMLYARSSHSMLVKSYLLEKLSIVSDEHPSQWMTESLDRLRATKIEPTSYFSEWAYDIDRSLWPALGVTLREYVVKKKTASDQDSTFLETDDVVANKTPAKYLAYAVGNPPQFDFHEGDLFFPKSSDDLVVQVVAKRKLLEVHQIPRDKNGLRIAYQLVDDELAEWLKTGDVPRYSRIDAALSFSEVLRFSISSEHVHSATSVECRD